MDRLIERCEDFESKSNNFQRKVEEDNVKLRELEETCAKNSTKEDEFEEKHKKLDDDLVDAENRADFAERSVEKLETTIDQLQDSLYEEKKSFIELSKVMDQTLNDMMQVQ